MNLEGLKNKENFEYIKITPPPVELLLSSEKNPSLWPEEISQNKDFQEQVEIREKLIDRLNTVLLKISRPSITLEEAIFSGVISENEVSELYTSLSELLSSPDYARAALYIPFEFFPGQDMLLNDRTSESSKQFVDTYMRAWGSLLDIQDVRANFVDGDVLEVEMRTEDLPRVVKAAHLIPKLVESGMLKMEQVFDLLENSHDDVVNKSIVDTLPTLYGMGFIQTKELNYLKSLNDDFVHKVVEEIASYEHEKPKDYSQPTSLESLQEKLSVEFANIDSKTFEEPITAKRVEWLKEKDKNKLVEALSDDVCSAIISKKLEITDFSEADISIQILLVEGLRKAVESVAFSDVNSAINLYKQYEGNLLSLWQKENQETRDVLSKFFCRLYRVGVVDLNQINDLEIIVPDLSEPFSKNLKSIESETEDIKLIVDKIERDPLLSEFVYPVVIVYGSRLKGYGLENADIDVAVIVKPNTPFSRQEEIQERLKFFFNSKKVGGIVTEFWISENGENFSVNSFSGFNPSLGDKFWTHVLFGGAWEGDENVISELRNKLLTPYFRETDEIIYGRSAHELYLEELERDTLQYRLMHKGYERFYPSYNPMVKYRSDKIDGKSVFWDSGYRDTAIKLFASRVFLPKI